MVKINPATENLRGDMLSAFLLAGSTEMVNVTTLTTEYPHINTRYARELLGVLTTGGLLVQVEVEGSDEWLITDWVQPQSADDFASTTAMYAAQFDAWWTEANTPVATKTATKTKSKSKPVSLALNADPNRKCYCGCGEPVGKKSLYRPGHDARHAGSVARDMAVADPTSWDSMMAELPTGALKTKAKAHALRLANKGRVAQVKSGEKPAAPPIRDLDPIRVGRWEYPAREFNGITQRNTKRDGTGSWITV